MVATGIELRTALRAIAATWPPAAPIGGDGQRWAADDLRALLRAGEVDPLLTWLRQIGQQAQQDDCSVEQVTAILADIVTVVVQLAAAALPDEADPASLLRPVGAPLQAAGLAGYLDAAARAAPMPTGGDLADRLARMEAIHRINRAANASLHLTAMLDQVVAAVADVIGSDTCSIWTYHDETGELVLRAARGLNPEAIGTVRLRLGEAITGEAARTRQAIAARDARAHSAYKYIPTLGEEKYRSQVSVPILRYSVDRLVGVLTLKTVEWRDFDQDDLRFLRTVASELAIAIENAQLYQQTDARLREKVHELATLQRVSARMAETLDMGEVLQIIAYNAAELGRAQLVTIIRVNRETDELEVMASYGEESHFPPERKRVEQDLIREVVRMAAPMLSPQAGKLVGLTSAQRPTEAAGQFSIFGMPLRSIRGVLGGICLHYLDEGGPSDEQYSLLVSFANSAAIAIENAQLFADAQRNLIVKSALLQEMHHRVRNNLGMVSGLLRMQMRRVKEPSAQAALRQSISRIQSIAAVHDLLSRQEVGLTTVEEVAKRVVDEASSSLVPPGCQVRFHIADHAVKVTGRQATLLAVLITEMIANAMRHGLRDRDQGDIWIRGRVEGADVIVEIEDNGQGLPDDFVLERETGLGLQITRTLMGVDLGGRLAITNRPEGGTRVTFQFPFRARTGGASQD